MFTEMFLEQNFIVDLGCNRFWIGLLLDIAGVHCDILLKVLCLPVTPLLQAVVHLSVAEASTNQNALPIELGLH